MHFELWCWRRLLESPLYSKEIRPVHPKGNQSWIFIGRTDVEAETPILWPPDVKNWLLWKDPDAGKDWRQEEKRTTGWDGWMASPTQWTWVGVNSGSWRWAGRPDVLRSMGLQRVRYDWAMELTDWDDNMVFILQFVHVIHHIDWFEDAEKFLHPWIKFHLIMCYSLNEGLCFILSGLTLFASLMGVMCAVC